MKYLLALTIISTGFSLSSFAQNTPSDRQKMMDSIKLHYISEVAVGYPILRQFWVNTDFIGKSTLHSKVDKVPAFDAKIQSVRTLANFNLPIVSWGKNSLTLSLSYLQQDIQLSDVKNNNPALPVANGTTNRGTGSFTLSYGRSDSLFGKPVIYSLAVSGVTSETSKVQKAAALGTVMFTLKRTPTTAILLGAVFLYDPSVPTPFVPLFNYWHKFSPNTELYVDMPQRVMLKEKLSSKAWLWLGSDLGTSVAFFSPGSPLLPSTINYSTFEIKSGAAIEYRVLPKLIFSLRGGIINPISARAFKNGKSSNDYIISNNIKAAPFVSVSVSLLPFLNSLWH